MTSFSWYDVSDATVGLLFGLAGILGGYALRGLIGRWQAEAIEKQAKWKLEEANSEVKSILKEANIQARAEVVKAKEAFEKSTKTRRKELDDADARLSVREQNLEKKSDALEKKEQDLEAKRATLAAREETSAKVRAETEKNRAEAETRLQALAEMTREEARQEIYQKAEDEVRAEAGTWIRRAQEEAKDTADRKAAWIVSSAIQRYSVSHAAEVMTTTVPLPDDDVKGRIIGREGRNVRTLEAVTGVTVLIDDTPEAVVLSSFDPIRREIARQSLESLIADGRIHPARIEEVVKEKTENLAVTLLEAGETAAFEAQVQNVPADVLRTLGRLKFRTSFTQNVMRHSIEVANLLGMMAGEMDLDPALARRIGLFHDIGKALDQERQGGHATIGADFLKKHGENPIVVNAVASHHEDVPAESVYAVLCSAADAISSSRPGARMATTGIYVQRLADLEKIANSFKGVKKTFAVQAGREVRVLVDPNVVNDNHAMLLARDISRKIEANMQFPGQIRVVVIRESRCIEYAR